MSKGVSDQGRPRAARAAKNHPISWAEVFQTILLLLLPVKVVIG